MLITPPAVLAARGLLLIVLHTNYSTVYNSLQQFLGGKIGESMLYCCAEEARLELLTVGETARLLRLSPYTVRRLLREGKLRGVKVGAGLDWRVDIEGFEAYLSSGQRSEQQA